MDRAEENKQLERIADELLEKGNMNALVDVVQLPELLKVLIMVVAKKPPPPVLNVYDETKKS